MAQNFVLPPVALDNIGGSDPLLRDIKRFWDGAWRERLFLQVLPLVGQRCCYCCQATQAFRMSSLDVRHRVSGPFLDTGSYWGRPGVFFVDEL